MSVLQQVSERHAFAELSRFRTVFYGCLSARADAFFELTDALLCADGPTRRRWSCRCSPSTSVDTAR